VEHEAPQPWRRDRRPEAEEQNQKQRGRERKRGTTVERLGSGLGEGGLILLGNKPPPFSFFFWAQFVFGHFYGLAIFKFWISEYLLPCPYKFVFGFKS